MRFRLKIAFDTGRLEFYFNRESDRLIAILSNVHFLLISYRGAYVNVAFYLNCFGLVVSIAAGIMKVSVEYTHNEELFIIRF